jgi:site-specific DNA-methyltransferase (adenine-specific)
MVVAMPYDAAATVNESTAFGAPASLGESLRQARRRGKFTQRALAAAAGIDIATVQNLERGMGTLAPLIAVLGAIGHRFAYQPPDAPLGPWITSMRKSAGYSQAALALRVGLSKPTIIQIEHGRGNIGGLLRVFAALDLTAAFVPQADPLHGARLTHGDCLSVMTTLADRSIDAIIADLPYASSGLPWDQMIPLAPLWEQFHRLLKPTGVVVLTASQPFTAALVVSNPDWFKYALVWEKTKKTGFQHAKQKPLKNHEDILVFSPGTTIGPHRSKRQMTYNPQNLVELPEPVLARNSGMGRTLRNEGKHYAGKLFRQVSQTHSNYPTSVLKFGSHAKAHGEASHPTQKPLELMRYLVRTYSNPGTTILDCAMGSGTTGVAAVLEGRQFIGIEQDEYYFQMATERFAKGDCFSKPVK